MTANAAPVPPGSGQPTVYGDIGTSPLYSIKEAFKESYGRAVNVENVNGLLSLIAWVLVLIVSVKYVGFILRADNRGEGGVLALLALILQRQHRASQVRRRAFLIALGLFGGAFLYGDGAITPAISVLGAVEGLEVASPALTNFVIPLKSRAFLVFFLTIDLAFFLANLAKVPHGGWVPLAVAVFVFTLMTTWKRGRAILQAILQRGTVPIDMFLTDVERRKPVRVKGTAVFMTSDPEGAPVVLLHHLKHNKVLHEQVILLSIVTAEVPEVRPDERIQIESLGQGFFRVRASYGFMETPSVPSVLKFCGRHGINAKPTDVSYHLGRERLLPNLPRRSKTPTIGTMARWRKKLFVLMSHNARGATEFFGIPPNRVVELGTQIEF